MVINKNPFMARHMLSTGKDQQDFIHHILKVDSGITKIN